MDSQKNHIPVTKPEEPKPSAQEPKKKEEEKKKKKDDSRKVYDNIHGFIRFERRIWYFIDTPEFQKLRNIKQLGCLSWVFPGATHTRFQHSLGTGHLAQTFIRLLIKNNPERYKGMTKQQKQSAIYTVTLAGIMHDVGHGPFSHTFDNQIVNTRILEEGSNQVEGKKWTHEIGSQLIFRHIVEKYGLVDRVITDDEMKRVIRLIHGDSDGVREWEFQLISNKETGIDVDKLDYFRRDAFYLGAKGVQIDHQLLMNQARILVQRVTTQITRYHIGFPSKYALQVNQIFYSRYKLYKTYYFNNVSKGVQFMIMDVLKLVQPIFKFTEICRNIQQGPERIMKYVALTDNILERIQFLDEQLYQGREDFPHRIRQAKIILLKLKYRKIYKFVRQVQTSITLQRLTNNNTLLRTVFNPNNISNFITQQTQLSPNLFHIAISEAGYGLKEINPLKKVKFFRKQEYTQDDQEYIPLTEEEFKAENISILYTEAFAERFAKLYVTNVSNLDDVRRINEAFVLYFAIQPEEIGQIFNQMSMGRTNFYPPDTEEGNMIQLENYLQVNDPHHQQNLP